MEAGFFVSSVRLRRIAALAVSATALLALSGCGTSFDAQTSKRYDAGVGSNERGKTIDVLNALFVDNGDGTATFSASLLNKEDATQVLEAVTSTTTDGLPLTSTLSGELLLEPGTPLTPGKNADITISGDFPSGGFVKITLNFADAAPITVSAPVVTRIEMYEDVAEKPANPATDLEPTTTPGEEVITE